MLIGNFFDSHCNSRIKFKHKYKVYVYNYVIIIKIMTVITVETEHCIPQLYTFSSALLKHERQREIKLG